MTELVIHQYCSSRTILYINNILIYKQYKEKVHDYIIKENEKESKLIVSGKRVSVVKQLKYKIVGILPEG